jgi:F-type H+-transporting ATPase subunit b
MSDPLFDATRSLFLLGGKSSGGAVDIDLDPTVFGQVALFVVLLLVLKPVLFDPMLRLFEEREKRTDGAKAEGSKLDQESAEALAKYESEMAKARAAANAERDKLRAEGTKAEGEILAKVRTETDKTLEEGRAAASREAEIARAALVPESKLIGRELASRVLGREI